MGTADLFHSDSTWLSQLAFSVDITIHMTELNMKFQQKDRLICDRYIIIKAFRIKLSKLEEQLERRKRFHFRCFKQIHPDILDVNLKFPKNVKFPSSFPNVNKQFLKKFSDCGKTYSISEFI